MINKSQNIKRLNKAKDAAQKYNLVNIVRKLEAIERTNEDFKINVVVVGGFSAGKSALLNKVLHRDLLVEDQAPETAVATELYYDVNESVKANFINGDKETLTTTLNIDVDQVRNLEYYIPAEALKNISDYILVDTPGFDSGIEKHNKALMQYVGKGTAYILVVDCERGTISESALNFIDEISHYSGDIGVVINKCDKKIASEIEEIKEYIEDLLLGACGRTLPVVCTSKYDEDAGEKVLELIQSFNPQQLYEKHITSLVDESRSELISALEIIEKNTACNVEELEKEIEKREASKKYLLDKVEVQRKRMHTKLHNETKENILNNIMAQLMDSTPMLISAYKGGVELLQEKVVEIIRPIMMQSIELYAKFSWDDFIKHLNINVLEERSNIEELNEVMSSVYTKLQELNTKQNILLAPIEESADSEFSNAISSYKAATSLLAIVTDFVAPPLELIIVFLPEIIKLLNMFIGKSKEQQLEDAMQNRVIPQIINKLRSELDRPLNQVEKAMIENLNAHIKEIIDVENEALEMTKNKIAEEEQDYAKFIDEIQENICLIRE